jgi:hypothetical protein
MTPSLRSAPVAVLLLAGAALALAAGVASNAQSPSAGFSAKGALVVQTELSGAKLDVGGNIALEQRGQLVRVDVLSLGIPGMNPTLNALASSQLIPAGGYSLVYDQAKRSYTVWSSAKRTYYSSEGGGQAPAQSNPAVAAATAVGSAGDIMHAFSAAKALRDYRVFSASIDLTGHGTTNGHPTTGLNFAIKRQEKTGDLLDVHGQLHLADDLNELPVQIAASLNGAGGAPPTSLRLDLTSVDAHTPADADFVVPQGFSKAAQISDVLGRTLP